MLTASLAVAGCLALALAVPAAGDLRPPPRASVSASATERVNATLAALTTREASLEVASARASVQLRVARRLLVMARRNLGRRLRTLYETPQAEPLEVLLGATSPGDALAALDGLRRSADQDRAWIAESRTLRRQAEQLSRELSEELLAVERLRESTETAAAALATLEVPPAAPDPAPRRIAARAAPAPDRAPAVVAAAAGRTALMLVSAYALPGFTATGTPVGYGVVAVDPAVIPLGTHLSIPGYGEAIAADTGSAIRGSRLDVWFPTVERARAWGTRSVMVTIQRG